MATKKCRGAHFLAAMESEHEERERCLRYVQTCLDWQDGHNRAAGQRYYETLLAAKCALLEWAADPSSERHRDIAREVYYGGLVK